MKRIKMKVNPSVGKSGIPLDEIRRCLDEGLDAKKKESEILRKMCLPDES